MGKRFRRLASAALVPLLLAAPARAYEPAPNGVRAGVAWEHLARRDGGPKDGVGAFVGYRRALSDDWDAWVQVAWAGLPRRDGSRASDVLAATGGFSLILDDATFRPEIFLGAGFLGSVATGDLPPDGMALVGAALEYQPFPRVSFGLRAEFRVPFVHRDRVGSATSLGLNVTLPF